MNFSLSNLSHSLQVAKDSLVNTYKAGQTQNTPPPVNTAPTNTETFTSTVNNTVNNVSAGVPNAWASLTAAPTQTAPAPPANGDQTLSLANNVKLTKTFENGTQTALKALLPGIPGGGHLLPAPLLLTAHTNAQGQMTDDLSAVFLGADQKPLVGADGQVHELRATRTPDGNLFITADDKNPNAPLMMFREDGSYGVSSRPQQDPSNPQNFFIQRSETLEADGTKTMKFNETIATTPQPQQQAQPLANGLAGGFGSLLSNINQVRTPAGTSAHHYTEVRYDAQNHLTGASTVNEYLQPGQKSPGAATTAKGFLNQASGGLPLVALLNAGGGGPTSSRVDSPLVAQEQGGEIHTNDASLGSKVFSSLTGHGRLTQMQATGPQTFTPFSTNELATPESTLALYPTLAEELK